MPQYSRCSSPQHRLLFICLAGLVFVLLQGCGVPGPSGGNTQDQSSDAFIPEVTFLVSVNTNELNLSNNLASSRISLVQLNEDFESRGSLPGNVPAYQVVKESSGVYEIQFGDTYPQNLNVVLSARLSNDEVLYAPLYTVTNQSDTIEINTRSHYVLKKLFDTITTRTQLNQLQSCDNSGNYNCANQPDAKARLLANLSKQAAFYELNITDSDTVAAALNKIDAQTDIRTHVETAVAEITRQQSPIAKGTRRNIGGTLPGDVNDRLRYTEEYNSVLFGLSLNQLLRTSNNASVINDRVSIATLSSDPVSIDILSEDQKFSDNINLLDLRTDALSSNIIHRRTTLTFEGTDISRDSQEPNVDFGFSVSDSLMSTESYLLATRRLLQTISPASEGGDPSDIGWQLNPVYGKLYRANDYEPDTSLETGQTDETPVYDASPTWLLASNYSTAATYFDGKDPFESRFERGNQREDIKMFTWEVHGLKTDNTFSASDINGKAYGVVSYSLKLNATGNILELFAETMRWDAQNGLFSVSQPNNYYRSYTLTRNSADVVTSTPDQVGLVANDYSFTLRETPDIEGFIQLDNGSRAPIGHTTQDGGHLAFAMDTVARGRGMMLVSELNIAAEPLFTGETYQIQGNSFAMTASENILSNLNGSQLVLESDTNSNNCTAELTWQSTRVAHDITAHTLSESSSTPSAPIPSASCTQDLNAIEIQFGNINGSALTLKGFVSQAPDSEGSNTNPPGRVLSLLWIQNDRLGLVYALKNQSLNPEFDE